MASENWHDHENAFGYRHAVEPTKVVGGAFAFVGFVAAGVVLIVRRHWRRRQARQPVPMTPSEVSALIVSDAVAEARREFIRRTNTAPVPRKWDSLGGR